RSLQDACRCHGRQNGDRDAEGFAKSGVHSASWPSVDVCWRAGVKTLCRDSRRFIEETFYSDSGGLYPDLSLALTATTAASAGGLAAPNSGAHCRLLLPAPGLSRMQPRACA